MSNTKVCSKCKVEKDVGEFSRRASARDGKHPHCKACCSTYFSSWAKENAEHLRVRNAEWRKANPEKFASSVTASKARNPEKYRQLNAALYARNRDARCEKSREWYRNNTSRSQEANRKWREANPEKFRERVTAWKEANPEKVRAIRARNKREAVDLIKDTYVKDRLNKAGVPDPPPKLIDKKREQLMAHREARLIAKMFRKRDRGEDTTEIENELMALIERHLELEDKE